MTTPPADRSVEPGDSEVGLCFVCRQARRVRSDRGSLFYLCERSRVDPAFPMYPRLPVVECAGFELAPSLTNRPGAS